MAKGEDRAHRSSSAENGRVCHGARLASELAPQRHNVLLGARQLPLQHVHPHAGIRLHVPIIHISTELGPNTMMQSDSIVPLPYHRLQPLHCAGQLVPLRA